MGDVEHGLVHKMSYDILFKAKIEGIDRWVSVGDCSANITSNVRKIIELSTGLPWLNEKNNGLCSEIIPSIERGYLELVKNGEKYKQYEAENGRGTVDGTKQFFRTILDEWHDLQSEDPVMASVATFWIT